MTNYLFQLSTKFDKYEADKYVSISVGMPVVNSSLSSHHFSPSKVVKVVFRNLVRARTELIEAQAVCLVMLDYGPEIDFQVSILPLTVICCTELTSQSSCSTGCT